MKKWMSTCPPPPIAASIKGPLFPRIEAGTDSSKAGMTRGSDGPIRGNDGLKKTIPARSLCSLAENSIHTLFWPEIPHFAQ